MSLMWVSVTECNQSHIYHLTQMIKEDENLQILLSYGAPDMNIRDGGVLRRKIEHVLSLLGVPSHLKGCQYLKTGIDLCIQSMEELDGITKRLYPDIAGIHHTTAETVEHARRPGREGMKIRRKGCSDTAIWREEGLPTRNSFTGWRIILSMTMENIFPETLFRDTIENDG